MAEQDNTMSLTELLEAHRRERERLVWEGTFREYFELVTANPRLSSLSHARICDMILAVGMEKIAEGTRDEVTRYNFFSRRAFRHRGVRLRRSSNISNRRRNGSKCANGSCC